MTTRVITAIVRAWPTALAATALAATFVMKRPTATIPSPNSIWPPKTTNWPVRSDSRSKPSALTASMPAAITIAANTSEPTIHDGVMSAASGLRNPRRSGRALNPAPASKPVTRSATMRPATYASAMIAAAARMLGTAVSMRSSMLLVGSATASICSAFSAETITGIRISAYTTSPGNSDSRCVPLSPVRPTRSPTSSAPTDWARLATMRLRTRAASAPTARMTPAATRLGANTSTRSTMLPTGSVSPSMRARREWRAGRAAASARSWLRSLRWRR